MMMATNINSLKEHTVQMDVSMSTSNGDYDVVLVSLIPKKYKCPLCNHLMRAPIQTYRGEMACESCYVEAVENTSRNICPIDHEVIETQNGEIFFKDNHARREILQLQCYCSYRRNACEWIGPVSDLEPHSRLCEFKEIICTMCNDLVLRKNEIHHITEECKFRRTPCSYCGVLFDAQSLAGHSEECQMKPMQCPYDCGQAVSIENVFQHVKNCPNIERGKVCPYNIVGCTFEPRIPGDLQNHMINDAQLHAAATIALVTKLNQSNQRLKQELLNEQKLQREMAKKMEEQVSAKSSLTTEIEKIKGNLHNVQQEGLALVQAFEVRGKKIKDDIEQIDTRLHQSDFERTHAKVEEMTRKYEKLELRIRSQQTDRGRSGGVRESREVVYEEMKQVTMKINELETGNALLSANLADIELKFQLFENTSYSGKQLWKVDNVMYRMQQAVIGRATAVHSAPCYQKKGGYKFCTRLYLNGDGMGRGTHISLFFVLMKSDHDALLKWPFSERVTFRLINPYNNEECLTESFTPDPHSPSFKKPSNDMNIAAGCPMFLRKDKLPHFIIEDVIFIECSVGS